MHFIERSASTCSSSNKIELSKKWDISPSQVGVLSKKIEILVFILYFHASCISAPSVPIDHEKLPNCHQRFLLLILEEKSLETLKAEEEVQWECSSRFFFIHFTNWMILVDFLFSSISGRVMYICGVKQDENSSVVVTPNREERRAWEQKRCKGTTCIKDGFCVLARWLSLLCILMTSRLSSHKKNTTNLTIEENEGGDDIGLEYYSTQPLPHTPNTTMLNEAAPLQSSQPFVLQSYWVTILIITCLLQATKQKLLPELGYKSRLSMFLRCKICILEAKEEIQIMSVEAILSFRILWY